MQLITHLLNQYATNKEITIFVKSGLFSLSDSEGAIKHIINVKSFEYIEDYADNFYFVTLQDGNTLTIFV